MLSQVRLWARLVTLGHNFTHPWVMYCNSVDSLNLSMQNIPCTVHNWPTSPLLHFCSISACSHALLIPCVWRESQIRVPDPDPADPYSACGHTENTATINYPARMRRGKVIGLSVCLSSSPRKSPDLDI